MAALPLVGVSAWRALMENIGLSKGQRILIHGGAGGIGSIAIQLAKYPRRGDSNNSKCKRQAVCTRTGCRCSNRLQEPEL